MPAAEVLANLSPRSTVLSPDRDCVASFDREGRWIYYFRRGSTYKRSLASEVHLRSRTADGARHREKLSEEGARQVFSEIEALVRRLENRLDPEARQRVVEEILPWSVDRLMGETDRFAAAYRPITILPPDQYRSVVLQAAEGCTWNRCTFCNFYMDRPFQMRSAKGFTEHVRAVKDLLGEGMRLRQGIFLADGNALALSNHRLDPLLEIALEFFPRQSWYGFVDLYSGERRDPEEWRFLAERGLGRVYVGMETGLDELLLLVDKPGSAAELEAFVRALKSAGLAVSLIVMIGLGGAEYRSRHRRTSLDLLRRLPLSEGDLIYLSPFVEHPGGRYHERRVASDLTPMNEAEVDYELRVMAEELRRGGLRVARYDIREFVY